MVDAFFFADGEQVVEKKAGPVLEQQFTGACGHSGALGFGLDACRSTRCAAGTCGGTSDCDTGVWSTAECSAQPINGRYSYASAGGGRFDSTVDHSAWPLRGACWGGTDQRDHQSGRGPGKGLVSAIRFSDPHPDVSCSRGSGSGFIWDPMDGITAGLESGLPGCD